MALALKQRLHFDFHRLTVAKKGLSIFKIKLSIRISNIKKLAGSCFYSPDVIEVRTDKQTDICLIAFWRSF